MSKSHLSIYEIDALPLSYTPIRRAPKHPLELLPHWWTSYYTQNALCLPGYSRSFTFVPLSCRLYGFVLVSGYLQTRFRVVA